MRIAILVACLVLIPLSAIGIYFAAGLGWLPFFFDPADPAGHVTLASAQKEADARKQLAFASLIEQLPKGKPLSPTKPLTAESVKRWQTLEHRFASAQGARAELLQALHEKTRRFFVESPGFGSRRGIIPPERILMWSSQKEPEQPGEPADFPISPGESLNRVPPSNEFHFYHDIGLTGFLNPAGFGFVKDRTQVAGFKPHGFRYLDTSVHENKRWRIQHIQLVGILTHETPVVYLTDKLPSMEQVRQGKTRRLDYFEEAALPSLRDGEDLYIVTKDNTLRMLGALRATRTCQQCHDAEIGDLLGAFSYTLRE